MSTGLKMGYLFSCWRHMVGDIEALLNEITDPRFGTCYIMKDREGNTLYDFGRLTQEQIGGLFLFANFSMDHKRLNEIEMKKEEEKIKDSKVLVYDMVNRCEVICSVRKLLIEINRHKDIEETGPYDETDWQYGLEKTNYRYLKMVEEEHDNA